MGNIFRRKQFWKRKLRHDNDKTFRTNRIDCDCDIIFINQIVMEFCQRRDKIFYIPIRIFIVFYSIRRQHCDINFNNRSRTESEHKILFLGKGIKRHNNKRLFVLCLCNNKCRNSKLDSANDISRTDKPRSRECN